MEGNAIPSQRRVRRLVVIIKVIAFILLLASLVFLAFACFFAAVIPGLFDATQKQGSIVVAIRAAVSALAMIIAFCLGMSCGNGRGSVLRYCVVSDVMAAALVACQFYHPAAALSYRALDYVSIGAVALLLVGAGLGAFVVRQLGTGPATAYGAGEDAEAAVGGTAGYGAVAPYAENPYTGHVDPYAPGAYGDAAGYGTPDGHAAPAGYGVPDPAWQDFAAADEGFDADGFESGAPVRGRRFRPATAVSSAAAPVSAGSPSSAADSTTVLPATEPTPTDVFERAWLANAQAQAGGAANEGEGGSHGRHAGQ